TAAAVVPGVPQDVAGHVGLVLSGGVGSTGLAYWLRAGGGRVSALSFGFGERDRRGGEEPAPAAGRARAGHQVGGLSAVRGREVEHGGRTAARLGVAHQVVDLSALRGLLGGCSLTDDAVRVPDGHYIDSSMRATVVPNRNAIMLDVAVAWAVAVGAGVVAFG